MGDIRSTSTASRWICLDAGQLPGDDVHRRTQHGLASIGYFRYSWTLRAELVGQFVCNLLDHLRAHQASSVTVTTGPEDTDMPLHPWVDTDDMNAGYLLRGLDRLPRRGGKPEWQHSQDYLYEREVLPSVDFSDPRFSYRA